MNSTMFALGLASIMLCVGVFLRAKVPFLRNILAPASVIAGLLGAILMNTGVMHEYIRAEIFTEIVNQMFTISFISIALTSSPKSSKAKSMSHNITQGTIGMGLVWCVLYALTPAIGGSILLLLGGKFGMNPVYGTLIPFGFAQGPGQAATFGTIYEQYGWENAAMVGVTFAAIGFLAAFFVGIPLAKYGLRKKLSTYSKELNDSVKRGYFTQSEQNKNTEILGTPTLHGGNLETMTFHFALIGVCYVIAVGISKLLLFLPGFLGGSLSGMMFMNGMFAAYIVKFIMNKLNISFLKDDMFQSKITGWTADYLVVCSFMAVQLSLIGKWIIPIIIIAVVATGVTAMLCIYFGQRFGGDNDFERSLGLFGIATGTVPSGIALVRIVDSELKTTTAIEMGMMNLVMLCSMPVYITLLAYASGTIGYGITLAAMLGLIAIYLIMLRLFKCWNKKTFSWREENAGKQCETQ